MPLLADVDENGKVTAYDYSKAAVIKYWLDNEVRPTPIIGNATADAIEKAFAKAGIDLNDSNLNTDLIVAIVKGINQTMGEQLEKMLNNERETYEEFFKTFGIQLKFGVYNSYGMNKDQLKDLLLFTSSFEKKPVTLKEYVGRLKDGQDKIYYACGETADKIEMLPQTERVKEKGYEILYLTEYVDEFCVKMLGEYDGKQFLNICDEKLDLDTEEEKNELKEKNEESKELLEKIKDALDGSVSEVRFTNKLKNYAVCLTSEGNLSLEMEKVLNSMPTEQKVKADVALEINASHPIADKLKEILSSGNEEELKAYAKLLYAQGCLISGVSVKDPAELSKLISDLMVK